MYVVISIKVVATLEKLECVYYVRVLPVEDKINIHKYI